jgi:multisubunit Na+/H+ antiporter MnhG subunit
MTLFGLLLLLFGLLFALWAALAHFLDSYLEWHGEDK